MFNLFDRLGTIDDVFQPRIFLFCPYEKSLTRRDSSYRGGFMGAGLDSGSRTISVMSRSSCMMQETLKSVFEEREEDEGGFPLYSLGPGWPFLLRFSLFILFLCLYRRRHGSARVARG